MAEVRELRPGVWFVRVYIGQDIDGKKKRKSKTVHGTKRDAMRVARELESLKDAGKLHSGSNRTVNEAFDEYLHSVQATIAPKTYLGRVQTLKRPRELFGARYLTALTRKEVQDYINELVDRGLKPSTIHQAFRNLKQALTFALHEGYIHQNPADRVNLPRNTYSTADTMTALTEEQVRRLLTEAAKTEWYALIALRLETGLRPSEAFALTYADIDLERRVIRVHSAVALDKNHRPYLRPSTKTGRSREIFVSQNLIDILLEHQERFKSLITKIPGLIFATIDGGLMNPSRSAYYFKRILKAADLPPMRFYDLRHTAASVRILAGQPLPLVRDILGHSSLQQLSQTYARTNEPAHQEAADDYAAMAYPEKPDNTDTEQ